MRVIKVGESGNIFTNTKNPGEKIYIPEHCNKMDFSIHICDDSFSFSFFLFRYSFVIFDRNILGMDDIVVFSLL